MLKHSFRTIFAVFLFGGLCFADDLEIREIPEKELMEIFVRIAEYNQNQPLPKEQKVGIQKQLKTLLGPGKCLYVNDDQQMQHLRKCLDVELTFYFNRKSPISGFLRYYHVKKEKCTLKELVAIHHILPTFRTQWLESRQKMQAWRKKNEARQNKNSEPEGSR